MPAELVCRADDPQWLAERRKGVTATDIPAILGLSHYGSLYSAYWQKVGGYEDPAQTLRNRLGHALESHIVELWEESLPVEEEDFYAYPGGLFRSAARPWQLATPDRLQHGTREPIECKSWGTTDGWGPDGSGIMPLAVRAQVLWQMDVLGSAAGHVAVVFLPSGEFRSYRIEHAPGMHAQSGLAKFSVECRPCEDIKIMREAGEEFWRRVTELDPPSPDGSAATLAALKARFGKPDKQEAAEIRPELRNCWLRAKERKALAEEDMRIYEAKMREAAGDAGLYQVGGETFARRERFTANVKAHDRVTDRLMPVKPREDNDQ